MLVMGVCPLLHATDPRSVGETSLKQEKLKKRNQQNALFIFMAFRNHRKIFLYYFTSTSFADSENQIKKGHRNLECQQNDNIPRSVGETSLKQENFKTVKINKMIYLCLWLSGIIGESFLCYFTSSSVVDSENQITKDIIFYNCSRMNGKSLTALNLNFFMSRRQSK